MIQLCLSVDCWVALARREFEGYHCEDRVIGDFRSRLLQLEREGFSETDVEPILKQVLWPNEEDDKIRRIITTAWRSS